MVRSLMMGVALMFSFLSSVQAQNGSSSVRQQPLCACVKAPCDCEGIDRALGRRRGDDDVTLADCSDGDFRPAHLGPKSVCYYENIFCSAYRGNSREYVRMKGIKAYCLPSRNGECPNAEDCVNTDDVSPSDFRKVVLDPPRTGDVVCNDSEDSDSAIRRRPQQTPSTRPAGSNR